MRKKVLYLIKAGEDFYDLIRSVMPDDRYELLTLTDGSNEERRQLLEQAELVIVGGARMSEKDVDAAVNLRLVLHQGVGYHDTVATSTAGTSVRARRSTATLVYSSGWYNNSSFRVPLIATLIEGKIRRSTKERSR